MAQPVGYLEPVDKSLDERLENMNLAQSNEQCRQKSFRGHVLNHPSVYPNLVHNVALKLRSLQPTGDEAQEQKVDAFMKVVFYHVAPHYALTTLVENLRSSRNNDAMAIDDVPQQMDPSTPRLLAAFGSAVKLSLALDQKTAETFLDMASVASTICAYEPYLAVAKVWNESHDGTGKKRKIVDSEDGQVVRWIVDVCAKANDSTQQASVTRACQLRMG